MYLGPKITTCYAFSILIQLIAKEQNKKLLKLFTDN